MLGGKGNTPLEKVLGLIWNCDLDTFQFNLNSLPENEKGLIVTKMNILSILAGPYDPLGLISPIAVLANVLFQELCIDKVGWVVRYTKKMLGGLD